MLTIDSFKMKQKLLYQQIVSSSVVAASPYFFRDRTINLNPLPYFDLRSILNIIYQWLPLLNKISLFRSFKLSWKLTVAIYHINRLDFFLGL